MKRAFIVHGWDGKPENEWYPWLKKELEANGYTVQIPLMPNSDSPKIEEWVSFLKQVVGNIDSDTHFACHSIGCQTLLRLLESEQEGVKVGGVLFVAPWMNIENLEDPESEEIAKPWVETPINWDKIRSHLRKVLSLFSTNDPWIPLSEAKIFEKELSSKTMIIKNQNHFIDKQLPISIDKIIKTLS